MATITKKELIDRIADTTNHRRVQVKKVVQQFLDEIVAELGKGNRLEFRDFGVFESKLRKARRAQNPKTLQPVAVPEKRTVKFKVGRLMKQKLAELTGAEVDDEAADVDEESSTPEVDDDKDESAVTAPMEPGGVAAVGVASQGSVYGGWPTAVADALAVRRGAHALRVRRPVRTIDATHIEVDGRRLVNFASNDYLGLSHHPAVLTAWRSAACVGSGAAPLVTGHTVEHATAEAAIARWKGTESAVLLGSGFAANAAAVGAIAAVGGTVRFLVDKLAHASLIDAVRGSGVPFRVFPHNNVDKLARLLREADPGQRQVIVTESIYSMDGDAADLVAVAELRDRHGCLLLLDEAHAAGVYGSAGAGLAAELSVRADLSVVTLSKAVGVVGGAVCGSTDWVEAVVNFGRPYVFSTSLPPAVATAITASIGVMADEPWRQARLHQTARLVRQRFAAAGVALPPGDSPIVPIVLGTESAALAAAERLLAAGMLVAAIRPPTVARGTSRLRITLSCDHTDGELDAMTAAVVAATRGP